MSLNLSRCGLALWAVVCGCAAKPPPPRNAAERQQEAPALATTVVQGSSNGARETRPQAVEVPSAPTEARPPEPWLSPRLSMPTLDAVVEQAIARGELPGCVIVAGTSEGIGWLKAYGQRSLEPAEPMTVDTVFDVASVTKAVATTSSLMRLAEQGKLEVQARVAQYLPRFAVAGKADVRVRHLLTHTSGLPRVNSLSHYESGPEAAFSHIFGLRPAHPIGQVFNYSDLGFLVLGRLVERLAGMALDQFSQQEVFEPLGMTRTRFRPPASEISQIAPTEERDEQTIRGVVDDPRSYRLGGVAGNAGLFSDARDLARFSRMLLRGGELEGVRIFKAQTLKRWTTPLRAGSARRTLGWDVESGYAKGRGHLMSRKSFGHSGYTGVSGWLDPDRDLFVWLLSNRVHAGPRATIYPLASSVVDLAVDALEQRQAEGSSPKTAPHVRTGIDVLKAQAFAPVRGRRVALLTNRAARSKKGRRSFELLRDTNELSLVTVWTPEHGLSARQEGHVKGGKQCTLPIHSLFGRQRDPQPRMLHEADTIVVDLQDVGVRFYTYAATVGRVLAFAASQNIPVWILDRPNPLGGQRVAGPITEAAFTSFVNHHPLPIQHGLTLGELARLLVKERELSVALTVVPIRGWRRDMLYPETGLPWHAPSPNLRRFRQVVLYPAVALVEGTNVSVGRGTKSPFELVGAPFIDAAQLVEGLKRAKLRGVQVKEAHFRPRSGRHRGTLCHGARLSLDDPAQFDAMHAGLALIRALMPFRPAWNDERLGSMVADARTLQNLNAGVPISEILADWQSDARSFQKRRRDILLYPLTGNAHAAAR